jgi:hypothetical protein
VTIHSSGPNLYLVASLLPIGLKKGLTHEGAWHTAVALLHFDFNYDDLIHWMEGEYTNAHGDWSSLLTSLAKCRVNNFEKVVMSQWAWVA